MTIETPAYFGLIARKNERTRAYIEQRENASGGCIPREGS